MSAPDHRESVVKKRGGRPQHICACCMGPGDTVAVLVRPRNHPEARVSRIHLCTRRCATNPHAAWRLRWQVVA